MGQGDRRSARGTVVRRPWTAARLVGGVLRVGPRALLDCLVVFVVYLLATGVRTGGRLDAPTPAETASLALVSGVIQVAANAMFAVYWRDWGVAALEDLVALLKASMVAFAVLLLLDTLTEPHAIPYAALFGGASVVVFAEAALKLQPRWGQIFRAAFARRRSGDTIVIVGAGRTGQLLARDLLQHGVPEYRTLCFLDDDPRKWGTYVRGIRVEGSIDELHDLLQTVDVNMVVLALAQPRPDLVRRVVRECEGWDVRVRAVSGVSLAGDTRALRPLGIDELLGRDPIDLRTPEASAFLRGRRVLITGAAGSIGSELARQVIALEPAELHLLDISESGLYDLVQAVDPHQAVSKVQLMDIRDGVALNRLFRKVRPEVIFHAAAYKHVPILEAAIAQAVSTNVLGTANVLTASEEAGGGHLVFISTDKAVEPMSVLGYTKRVGELLVIAHARQHGTNYCVVRFGNVLGSNGSVVPLFDRQIDAGGPVTVTHRDATRFFMTSAEASGLVIQAGAIARPGDLLVLDMGSPILIGELARKMIRLRGLRTPGDIVINYTGLRPGEKLHEQLFFRDEVVAAAEHPRVMRVRPPAEVVPLEVLRDGIRALQRHMDANDDGGAVSMLRLLVHPDSATQLVLLRQRAARERNSIRGEA